MHHGAAISASGAHWTALPCDGCDAAWQRRRPIVGAGVICEWHLNFEPVVASQFLVHISVISTNEQWCRGLAQPAEPQDQTWKAWSVPAGWCALSRGTVCWRAGHTGRWKPSAPASTSYLVERARQLHQHWHRYAACDLTSSQLMFALHGSKT